MAGLVRKTRGEIRSKVLSRIGFGGLGASAGNAVPWLDDLLDEAQEQLFEMLPQRLRERYWDITLSAGQEWYDLPTDCDPDRIEWVQVQVAGYWTPIVEGITPGMDSVKDTTSWPLAYELRHNPDTGRYQLIVSPLPDQTYPLRIRGEMKIGEFNSDDDLSSLDYRLIVLYATAYGKAHLNRPDKKEAMDALVARLRELKAAQHTGKRYIRRLKPAVPLLAKPRVVE